LINIIIVVFIILEELRDQFTKGIPSDVLYNILDCTLNDIVELDLQFAVFYDYIIELLELCKVSKEDI